MEHENQIEITSYDFLKNERVTKRFADINIELLRGRHIQADDYYLYQIISDFYPELSFFYKDLYGLKLEREKKDGEVYYYLNFFGDSKGKLTDTSRYKELTELQTIIGLMLLDMYFTKYLDSSKEISWSDIKQEIEQGELKDKYQMALFGEIRPDYFEQEWAPVFQNFKRTIISFHQMGWVNKLPSDENDLLFELRTSINRLASLYREEIEHFPEFLSTIKLKEEE